MVLPPFPESTKNAALGSQQVYNILTITRRALEQKRQDEEGLPGQHSLISYY